MYNVCFIDLKHFVRCSIFLSLTHTNTYSLSISLSLSLTISLCLSLSLALSLTHTHTHTRTHTHTQTFTSSHRDRYPGSRQQPIHFRSSDKSSEVLQYKYVISDVNSLLVL